MNHSPASIPDEELTSAADRLNWLLPLAIAIATVVAFYPALDNEYVWDDEAALQRNEHIRSLSLSNLGWMFTTRYTGPYQPLSWLSLAIDRLVWRGRTLWGTHLTSILLHAGAAVVFFYVARRLLAAAVRVGPPSADRARSAARTIDADPALCWAAAGAAVVFALHPLRAESVAWLTERRDVLSGLLFMVTVFCYLRYAALPVGAQGRTGWYVAALVLYAMTLLSKATTVTLPIVMVVLDLYPLRRLRTKSGAWRNRANESVLAEKLPFLALALATGLIALAGQAEAGAMMELAKHGILARILVAVSGVGFYLSKTVLPIGLSPMYELPASLGGVAGRLSLNIVVAVAVTIGVIWLRRRFPSLGAVWLSYVVMLLPMLGFIQVGVQMAADRYSYLPGLSLAVLAGGVVLAWWRRSGADDPQAVFRAPAVVVLLVAGVLASLTWRQCEFWQNEIELWSRAARVDGRSAVSYYNLGTAWERIGKGRDQAIAAYHFAVAARPDYALAWQNLGNILVTGGDHEEAIEAYQRVLKLEPRHADALANMGVALIGLQRYDEAVKRVQQAIAIDKTHAAAHNTLGLALVSGRKLDEGIEAYRKAMELDPTYVRAYENLLGILVAQRRFGEAVDVLRTALKHMPDHLELANTLAYILATCRSDDVRNGPEALELALRICQETGYRRSYMLDTLAAAHAEVGEFEKAVQAIQRAIDLISATDPKTAQVFRERRRQYQVGKPLRRSSY